MDRRRYKRFDTASVLARVALIQDSDSGLRLGECALRNVSYGGMAFSTPCPLEKDTEYRFLIDLGAPFRDMVLVKARVVWVEGENRRWVVGARFLESSKGWLGPDEDGEE